MCMYVSSEVVLANLLNYYPQSDNGVDFMLIENYCNSIKKRLSQNTNYQSDFILFQINDYELEKDMQLFPKHFNRFMSKYYKGADFNSSFFNNRYKVTEELANIMQFTAQEL